MAKQRQFPQAPQTPGQSSIPAHPNIVLVDRCHPEKIVEVLAAKYFQDLRAFYGYTSPPLDEVRDFTRALISGEIELENIPLAREVTESELSKADKKDGKEFALALAKIAHRHNSPLDISDELVTQLFNRGLLPLLSLAPDQQTLGALSKETGISIDRVAGVLTAVEQSDQTLRAITLSEMFSQYMEEKREHLTPAARTEAIATGVSPISANGEKAKPEIRITETKVFQEAEERLKEIIRASSLLTLDTSKMGELIDTRLLRGEPVLPTIDNFASTDPDDQTPIYIAMNPTNMWVDAVVTSRTRRVISAPIHELDKALALMPVDERATRTFIAIVKARTTDVFIESAIANTTARFLIESPTRDANFLEAVKDLENVVRALDALHKNTILALRDPDQLKERIADTDKFWRKLAHNSALLNADNAKYGSIHLANRDLYTADDTIIAAMIYHLPPSVTESLFANTFGGLVWDLSDESFAKRLAELAEIDPDSTRMDQARGWRTRYGTTGTNIVTRDQGLGIKFTDKDELVRVLRPVSKRYDPLFTGGSKTMTRDLDDISFGNPGMSLES